MKIVKIICNRCGETFEAPYGSRKQYCPTCRSLVAHEAGEIGGKLGGRPKKK